MLAFPRPAPALSGTGASTSGVGVVYTSQAGCISDADLSIGSSGAGTDNTAALQAVLDKALVAPLLVIWDGAYSCRRLTVYSNTYIMAMPNCGALLRSGTSDNIFRNANVATSYASTVDKNITIDGGIWNANGRNQSGAYAAGGWITAGIAMFGVKNLVIRDAAAVASLAYNIICGTIDRGYFENVHVDIDPGVTAIGRDGLHINGPCRKIDVYNVHGTAFDDFLAFNTIDGTYPGSTPGGGAISDVNVNGVVMDNSLYGVRLLCAGQRMDRVTLRNIKGSVTNYALIADAYDPSLGPGYFGAITVDDVDVVQANANTTYDPHPALLNFNDHFDQLTLTNIKRNRHATGRPLIAFRPRFNAGIVNINGLSIYDDNAVTNGVSPIIATGGLIDHFTLANINWLRASGLDRTAALIALSSGTIADLCASNVTGIQPIITTSGSGVSTSRRGDGFASTSSY